MKQFKVEKGYTPEGVTSKYPWGEMEIGESFFLNTPSSTRFSIQRNGRDYLRRNQIEGKKVVTKRSLE